MKMIQFDSTTFPKQWGGGKAGITFGKTGIININEKASERLKLKEGDKVAIAQDEEEPANWYIFKHQDGFEIRHTSDKKGFNFNHSALCRSVFKCFEMSLEKSHRFLVAEEETKIKGDSTLYWGLLAPSDES